MPDVTELRMLLSEVEGGAAAPSITSVRCWEGKAMKCVLSAYGGSIDAAQKLHAELLRGWVIHTLNWKWGGVVNATLFEVSGDGWHHEGLGKVEGRSTTAGRAWLIAILKALIAKNDS